MARKAATEEKTVVNPDRITPQSTADFLTRGWLYYYEKQYEKAEADFRAVLRDQPGDLDTQFALGLTLKGLSRFDEAVIIFEQIITQADAVQDHIRATMVKRLARGHINEMTQGDWNLEKEIWKRK